MLKKIVLSFLFFFIFVSVGFCAQVERVEPAFWWVDMKNPQVQLLVHGKDISKTEVFIKYQGVKLEKINKVSNPNFLFVDLLIDPKLAKAGKFDIVFKQNGKIVDTYSYELKSRRPGSAQREGFTSADVVYLLMPDRFANGNPSNDNVDSQPDKANRSINNGRHGGDIKGIQDHLDYIRELGATAIWSTPLLENNSDKFTYHGYAISDFYKVDPRFGSNQEYVDFVEASHKKGLKVIMDLVSNHGGIGAWWMKDLPMEDWVHQWPILTRTSHKSATIKDIHASKADKKIYLDGWFDSSMPDMNQQNPFFWTYYIQNSIWWVEYTGLDGIRMDTYPYNDRDAMAKWAKAITDEYPRFNIVGETWLYSSQDIAFWQKNSANSLKYNSQLPTVMDFILQNAMTTGINEHGKPWEDVGMARLYNTIANDYLYANINNLFIFAENHDTQRLNKLLNGDLAKYKMVMSFLMTTRGIPQIYYGSEIGMTGDKNIGDGDVRRDFPGGWSGDSINAFSAKGRTDVQNEYFDFQSKLLNWRKGKPVIHSGLLTHFTPENDIYVYFRSNKEDNIMVILNNNNTDQELKTTRFAECLQNKTTGVDVMTGKTYQLNSTLILPKESALILELR